MSESIQPFNLVGLPRELQGLIFDNIFTNRLYGTVKSHKALEGMLMETDDDGYNLLVALGTSGKMLEEALRSFGMKASYSLHDCHTRRDDDGSGSVDHLTDYDRNGLGGNCWRVYDNSLIGYDQRRFLAHIRNVNMFINDEFFFESRGKWMLGISDTFIDHGLPFRYNIRNFTIKITLIRSGSKKPSDDKRVLGLKHWLTIFPNLRSATVTVGFRHPVYLGITIVTGGTTTPWDGDKIKAQQVVDREDVTLERGISGKVRWFLAEHEGGIKQIYPGSL